LSRRGWVVVAALALVAVAGGLLLAGQGAAGPSALSPGPSGWLAARRYLEARGARVTLLDRSFGAESPGRVLVTAFPWSLLDPGVDFDALRGWVRRGGTLLVAYSGSERDAREEDLLSRFGLRVRAVRGEAPWGYLAWRRYFEEEWRLRPEPSLAGGGEVGGAVVRAFARAPASPKGARVLYRQPETDRPLVFAVTRGAGRVVLLPAAALANARLGEEGNGDLLESLLAWLGPEWTFDEYHHGLVRPGEAAAAVPAGVFDLFLAHLGLLYLLALVALGRRFGPPWREATARGGTAASFLIGLGSLHHRLGHHAEAARRLLARVRELEPGLALPADLDHRAAGADGAALVALAGEVARRRGRGMS
jgi:Domain of unknown function (DUF4350)